MNENLHDIDDLFKKAIDQHEDTPSQKVWDAIDKNLDKKKVVYISRKYNMLKWAAAILLLFSFGMAMYVWQTNKKNKELVKQNQVNKASRSKSEMIKNDDKKSTIPQIKTKPQNNNELKNERSTSEITNETSIVKKQLPVSQQKVIIQDEKTERAVMGRNKKSSNGSAGNKDQSINNKEIIPVEKVGIKEEDNNLPQKYIAEIPMIFYRSQLPANPSQIQPANPFSYTPGVISADKTVTGGNTNTTLKKKTTKATKTSALSATVFFSPEFVSSSVKDDHPRYREDNRHEIKNNEKIRSSSSYGLLVNYTVGNNWSMQSGISVFKRVTDINTKTIYARPDNGGNVNYRLSCSAGSAYVPLKSGTVPAQGDSTKILSARNTLQYISIPVSVKYSIGKGKFKLVPAVGISANILSKGKLETVIATTGGNQNSSTNNIEGLKSNYFSSQVSAGAELYLNNNISLNFTPTAKLALSSINKNAAVKTKLNSFGLSAGITIKL